MKKNTLKNCFIGILISYLFFNMSFVYSQDKSVEIQVGFSKKNSSKTAPYRIAYKKTSPFVMLSGFTKDMSFDTPVYYRLKLKSTWQKWVAFEKPHNAEGILDRVALGAIFIESSFEDIQFKTAYSVDTQFTFRLFFPEFTKKTKASSKITTNNKTLSGCSQPTYQGRSDWCPSGNCPKSSSPSAINPTHIVIHHSAGNSTSNDFAAVVRSYWDNHVNTHGWADIGYNWLVDPNGVIYEGRGDRVRGAHSPCMNAISTGICYIGNFQTSEPAAAGLTALKDFIAWDATDKGIDVLTSSQAGSLGTMSHISGHKDGKDSYPTSTCTATLCPGVNLHNKIPGIKTAVSNYTCYVSSANAPGIPLSFAVLRKSTTSVDVHIKAVSTAATYGVYKSIDNVTYQKVGESSSTTITIENLTEGQVTYFKIDAINSDGASDKSTPLAVIPSSLVSEILIIDGVERREFDIIAEYDYPLSELGRTFSSATNDAVQDGTVNLSDFKFVIWSLLDESSADDTFNQTEQTKVKTFIDNGGVFIVSGNEVGWDLVNKGDATDQTFFSNVLKASYIADNPDPLNYKVQDGDGLSYDLVQNPNDVLDARWPDLIKPLSGSSSTFTFDGVSSSVGVAGISYTTAQGGVDYLSFAIESVTNEIQRKQLLKFIFSKYGAYLSVKDSFIKQNISVYPNPTNGLVTISNPNQIGIKKVLVFTIFGQKLRSEFKNGSIDLSNFVSGIYLVKVEDKTGRLGTFKVVKR